MKHYHYTDVDEAEVSAPAKGVKVRWLINEETGAPNFTMRQFTLDTDGQTPRHTHPWEHEVFIRSGTGVVRARIRTRMPPDEEHQFRNTGDEELVFLCLIPH